MPVPIGPIAQAIAAGFKLLKARSDTAVYRRMRKAIEAGEKYIQVNSKSGMFEKLTLEKRKKKLLYYSKKFFKYNN